MVGRGREGWAWDNNGKNVDDVAVGVGTPTAFTPAYYSASFINGLISAAGAADLTDVEIRLKRASNIAGTAYEQAIWRPTTETAWRWNFD